jgi:hypothetical protein
MIPRQPILRFYEDDVFLTEAVASRIKLGLQGNDTLIVIIPASHRPDLRKLLTLDELANTHLMFFDTTSLLSKIMDDDWPNKPKLMKVRRRIHNAYQTIRLHVYGEMVAVLGGGSKDRHAIRLERLWNTLQAVYPFSLLYTHPHSTFTSKEDPQFLLAVHHDTHVHRQKTDTSPPRDRYIVATVVSLPCSLYIGTPRLLLCFARVARRRDGPRGLE